MVYKISHVGFTTQILSNNILVPDRNRCRTITPQHLSAGAALALAVLRCQQQGITLGRRANFKHGDQRRGCGALGGRHVHGAQTVPQIQSLTDHNRVLTIKERQSSRSQVQCINRTGIHRRQTVLSGLNSHSYSIFVPVADTALALGEATQTGIKPVIGVRNSRLQQAGPGNVGTVGGNTRHVSSFLSVVQSR